MLTRASAMCRARRAGGIIQASALTTRIPKGIGKKQDSTRAKRVKSVPVQKKASFGVNRGINASSSKWPARNTTVMAPRQAPATARKTAGDVSTSFAVLPPNPNPHPFVPREPRCPAIGKVKAVGLPSVSIAQCRQSATLACRFGDPAGRPSFVDKAGAGPYLRRGPSGTSSCRRSSARVTAYLPRFETVPVEGGLRRVAGLWLPLADRSTCSDSTGFCQMLSFGALAKVFGSANDRRIKSYRPTADAINALEPELEQLTDAELRARTETFRQQLADGTDLDELLVPAFATVREAARRTLGQRHFDVQMIGGMVLHQGKIAEMKTGEGKTLVATLAVYLNALTGRGVHVVTVNDYLAKRDAEWMGRIYKFLGLSVGCIVHDLDDDERREQYACDVTYGTNNELGFDYLRDNMKMSASEMVQRGHVYAIVDEVDSILIDEARTPLIISGPVEDRSELYNALDELVRQVMPAHGRIVADLSKVHARRS